MGKYSPRYFVCTYKSGFLGRAPTGESNKETESNSISEMPRSWKHLNPRVFRGGQRETGSEQFSAWVNGQWHLLPAGCLSNANPDSALTLMVVALGVTASNPLQRGLKFRDSLLGLTTS